MKATVATPALLALILAASSFTLCADEVKPQASSEKGAKALFVDSFSGAEVQATGGSKPAVKKSTHKNSGGVSAASSTTRAASTGLMYWVELLKLSGEAVRVTSDHVFHSGDRIRVHLTGSVEGDIAVYQRDPQGHAVQLFPDKRVNEGSSRVRKGASTIVPSATAWFRFDDQVGTERLLILLTPESHPSTVVAAAELNADRQYDQLRPAAGSKGLVLETDSSSAQPATYVVRSSLGDGPLDPISVEIVLRHER